MPIPISYILFLHGDTWQIARVDAGRVSFFDMLPPDANSTVAQIATKVAQQMQHIGYQGQPTMLAVASKDCYAARIDISDLPGNDRKAMVYRLEENLPIPAESFVADFVMHPKKHALGVAVVENTISPVVHALESSGIAIESIVPAALLTAKQLAITDATDSTEQLLLIGDGDAVNLILLSDGLPTHWASASATAQDIQMQLNILELQHGVLPTARSCGVDGALISGLSVSNTPIAPRHAAAICGAAILEGRSKSIIELRHSSLAADDSLRMHRGSINRFLKAAIVLLVCCTAALLWRGYRYSAAKDRLQNQMAEEFTRTFPGWAVPASIKYTVNSEFQKLQSQNGAQRVESHGSALAVLQTVLSKLPPEIKVKIDTMSFTDRTFEINGRVRSFNDVEAISSAARLTGMEVTPPQSHRDPEGFWSFTLHGDRAKQSNIQPRTSSAGL